MQFPATLVFVAEKSPSPTGWGKFLLRWIYPFHAIFSNFGFCGRKAPPHPGWVENFLHWICPFHAISSNFGTLWPKSTPPRRSREIFLHWIYPFHAVPANLVFVAEKPPSRMREISFMLDLSISCNFQQLWFLWQKSPSPPDEWKIFYTRSFHFMQFPSTFFCDRKSPCPPGWGIFFILGLSISWNFQQLCFLWQKSPTPPPHPGKGTLFLHWIYPFHAISSNFGFCSRKAPSQDEGNFFYTGSIHFMQFSATLVFVAEKPPPPSRMNGKLFTLDLSISCNFQQLWYFVAEKPPPPGKGNFFYTGSIHFMQFQQLWFLWQKSPLPGWGKFLLHWIYPFHAIFSNFGFCGRKAPPPPIQDEWKTFYTGSCHFMQFPATLVLCGRKGPPPRNREFFYTGSIHFMQFQQLWFLWQKSPLPGWGKFLLCWIYPFHAIFSNFGFCGKKALTTRWVKILFTLDLSISCNFHQHFFCGRKSPCPPGWGNFFLYWVYPFHGISSNLAFCGRKSLPPPPPRMRDFISTLDLSISCNFQQLWYFVAEPTPPLHQEKGKFFILDLSISCNFQQFWFLWQKNQPPLPYDEGILFLHWIYPFHAISSNFGFCGRKACPPPTWWGNFIFTLDLSISCNFQQLWFLWEKSPPCEGNFFTLDLSISCNFQQLWFLWL